MLNIISCAYCPSVCLLRKNVYLGLLPIFWLGCLFFCYWFVWAVCIFWKWSVCWSHCLQIFFPIPVGCIFVLFMVYFAVQKLISLIRSHLFIFAFISIVLGNWPKKTLLWFMSENVLPMFSSRSFMASCLIFKSKPFWVYFCVWCEGVF